MSKSWRVALSSLVLAGVAPMGILVDGGRFWDSRIGCTDGAVGPA